MRLIVAATAALLLSSSAFAAGDIMAATYGNTVIGKTAMFESHTHYNADHTFTASYSSSMGSLDAKGTWAVDGSGQLCRTFESAPPGMPKPALRAMGSAQGRRRLADELQRPHDGCDAGRRPEVVAK